MRCDQGSYSGPLIVGDCDLLQPLPLSPQEFEACRKRLTGGFNELVSKPMTAASLGVGESVTENGEIEGELVGRILRQVNLSVVQQRLGEVMLAGCFKRAGSEERALLTIIIDK